MLYLTKEQAKIFWSKVDIQEPNDCWNWKAYLTANGYGRFCLRGYNEYAHRISFDNTYKIKNYKSCICHKCDNRKCVNPNHLFEGTHQDNIQDMIKKGRGGKTKGHKQLLPEVSTFNTAEIILIKTLLKDSLK